MKKYRQKEDLNNLIRKEMARISSNDFNGQDVAHITGMMDRLANMMYEQGLKRCAEETK